MNHPIIISIKFKNKAIHQLSLTPFNYQQEFFNFSQRVGLDNDEKIKVKQIIEQAIKQRVEEVKEEIKMASKLPLNSFEDKESERNYEMQNKNDRNEDNLEHNKIPQNLQTNYLSNTKNFYQNESQNNFQTAHKEIQTENTNLKFMTHSVQDQEESEVEELNSQYDNFPREFPSKILENYSLIKSSATNSSSNIHPNSHQNLEIIKKLQFEENGQKEEEKLFMSFQNSPREPRKFNEETAAYEDLENDGKLEKTQYPSKQRSNNELNKITERSTQSSMSKLTIDIADENNQKEFVKHLKNKDRQRQKQEKTNRTITPSKEQITKRHCEAKLIHEKEAKQLKERKEKEKAIRERIMKNKLIRENSNSPHENSIKSRRCPCCSYSTHKSSSISSSKSKTQNINKVNPKINFNNNEKQNNTHKFTNQKNSQNCYKVNR